MTAKKKVQQQPPDATIPGERLTANIVRVERTYVVHDITRSGPAMQWRYHDKNGEPRAILLAPFEVSRVEHRRHIDVDGRPLDVYTVTTFDGQQTREVRVLGADLASLTSLREAFAAAGPIAGGPGGSATEGGAVAQLGSIITSARWPAPTVTVETLGRIHHGGRDCFALPGLTVDQSGPTSQPCYQPHRPNTAGRRVAVAAQPGANLNTTVTEFLAAAVAADPSPCHVQTAATLGWGAATCFASKTIASELEGGHPMLWQTGTPGSGKTERGVRLLAPFGVDSTEVAGAFSTVVQLRDTFSATNDVPQVRDEVKLDYLPAAVKRELPRYIKTAYNGQSVEVGGRFAADAFQQRSMRLWPTLAFNSEASPPQDQAVLDRVIVVPWQRLAMLPQDRRANVANGFDRLKAATADRTMAPAAAAWFQYAAGNHLDGALELARTRLSREQLEIGSRQLANFQIVLAGLYAYADFCRQTSPDAVALVLDLADELAGRGVALLAEELKCRQAVTGAVGVLDWLAILSQQGGTRVPCDGVHYRITDTALEVNAMHILGCLRMNAQQVGMPLPDDHAFIQEVKGWPGVTHAKRRAHGEPRATSPKAYWRIPWATLRSLDGPDRDQFNKATPL